jgi:DNA-binding NarL/FixJ family response regulator
MRAFSVEPMPPVRPARKDDQVNPANSANQPTVLIVEDHAPMRAGISVLLQSAFPGCRVHEAEHSVRALTICFVHQPRLILMDICLPDANGIEFTGRIRRLFPEVGVIIISNLEAPVYVEQAKKAGALDYIVKDRLSEELVPAVGRALGLAPGGKKRCAQS